MRSALALLLIVPAITAAAPPGQPRRPPPIGGSYLESRCSGGIAGMTDQVRVRADGRVERFTSRARTRPNGPADGRVPRAEVAQLFARLNALGFDGFVPPKSDVVVSDGINCSLTKVVNGRSFSVAFPQGARGGERYRALGRVRADIARLGDRVTLNPQPIPPAGDR